MKLEDLNRYKIVEECPAGDQCGTYPDKSDDGEWMLFGDVQVMHAAHKQREAELIAIVQELENALENALPFVEDENDSDHFKPGFVTKLLKQIHKAFKTARDAQP